MQLYVFSTDKKNSAKSINELRMQIELWVKAQKRETTTPCGLTSNHIGRIFLDPYLAAPVQHDFNTMLKDYEWCTRKKVAIRDSQGNLENLTAMGISQILLVKRMRDLGLDVWGTMPMTWATNGWSSDSKICQEMEAIRTSSEGEYAAITAETIRKHADHGINILITSPQTAKVISKYICEAQLVDLKSCPTPSKEAPLLEQIYQDLILQSAYDDTNKGKTFVIEHMDEKCNISWPSSKPEDVKSWSESWKKAIPKSEGKDCNVMLNDNVIKNLKKIADCWIPNKKEDNEKNSNPT